MFLLTITFSEFYNRGDQRMSRRAFVSGLTAFRAALRGQGGGPSGAPLEAAVERMTAGHHPTAAARHVVYRPRQGRKTVVVHNLCPDL